MSARPLLPPGSTTLQPVLDGALRQRADLVAAVARLRATDAGIALARSAFLPKLSVDANIQANIGQINVDGLGYRGVSQPEDGVFLRLDVPLYQGGLLQNKLRQAQSEHDAAADALASARNHTLREVATAYDQVETGLEQYKAALALQSAAQKA